ncbi:MAG TPA: cytochrome c oxidase assembly protein [Candidatus Acidoferrales bacterium]
MRSWSSPIALDAALVISSFIYARGWLHLRHVYPRVFSIGRLAAFLAALAAVWAAIASPLAAFDETSLTIHMIQHLLLMTVAPALFLLAAPALPLLHGLPQNLARAAVAPVLRWRVIQALGNFVTHPAVAWVLATFTLVVWHIPQVFAAALQNESLHKFEHATFLFAGLVFWWPVIQPWPSTARWPRWSIPVYLFAATLPCDVLSGFLVFCDRVVYTAYLSTPSRLSISPLQDQERAAALMWVVVTLILMVPAVVITMQILSPQHSRRSSAPDPNALPVYEPTR